MSRNCFSIWRIALVSTGLLVPSLAQAQQLTHTCKFDRGPRAGQTLFLRESMPVGVWCGDLVASSGVTIADNTPVPDRAKLPARKSASVAREEPLTARNQIAKVEAISRCSDRCIDYDDALKGEKAMSVFVEVEGEGDPSSESIIKSNVEELLRQNGISVLPSTDQSTFPALGVRVNMASVSLGINRLPEVGYVILLQFRQLLPVQKESMKGKFQRVTTWDTGRVGVMGAILVPTLRKAAVNLVSEDFLPAYRKANEGQ